MMIVPGASVLRYSTAVRLYSGSNSTESSGRSPGWSPASGCCAKLCETESIRPAAAIIIQIRCRNFVIQNSPRSRNDVCLPSPAKHRNHQNRSRQEKYGRSFRRDPQPPWRRRRARALRTTTGVAPAVAGFAPSASMVAAPGPDLAAEYPIGPSGITENEGHKDGDADQHEQLAVLRRCRLPDRDALRHNIGPHADAKSGIGQRE